MELRLFTAAVFLILLSFQTGVLRAGDQNHELNVFWGGRFGYFVLFNEVQYKSPDLLPGIPFGLEARLRTDETFYFFTFSAYSFSAAARYQIRLNPEWTVRTAAGFCLTMMPFYS